MKSQGIAVCIIVENLPVPFDRRVWQEARALAEAGYRVSVICPKGRGFEKSQETLEGVEIYRHALWEASGTLGYFIEYPWAIAVEFWLALKIYFRTRFRVLQACNPPDTIFLVALFYKLFGVRFVFDHHDLNPELFESKFGKRGLIYRLICLAERMTFRAADVSIATNESFKEIALTRGKMPPEAVFIVRSCPEIARIRPGRPRLELKQNRKFMVLYLGIMAKQDGLEHLLDSIEYIVKERGRQDVLFAFVGDGPEFPAITRAAKAKGLEPFTRFAGRLYGDALAGYLSTADVSVAPDPKTPMNDKSTMNKILESMAYARPVVLFDLVEGRRLAGDAALYAKPNDPVDFAEQVLRLLDSEGMRREMGARGRKRIEEQLNWEKEKQSLLKAYQAALKK